MLAILVTITLVGWVLALGVGARVAFEAYVVGPRSASSPKDEIVEEARDLHQREPVTRSYPLPEKHGIENVSADLYNRRN